MHWDIYIDCLDVYFCFILMKNKDKCEELCDEDGQFKTCDPYTKTCQTTGMVVHFLWIHLPQYAFHGRDPKHSHIYRITHRPIKVS